MSARSRAPGEEGKSITIRVVRYNPENGARPREQSWQLQPLPGMTVLDALIAVKEHQDGSLTFRCSCRMGVCGSCGMMINGKPGLACHTQVVDLGPVVHVSPLPNHDVIKDLVPDLSAAFAKHRAVKPYLMRRDAGEMDSPTREFHQTSEDMLGYVQFSYCLKCSLCLAACPTEATTPAFLGPQALAQAYRYSADTRDEGLAERAPAVDALHGVFGCHLAGACSEACPKGVDPALAIQLLKRALLFGPPHRAAAATVPAIAEGYRSPKADSIPQAPPPTIE